MRPFTPLFSSPGIGTFVGSGSGAVAPQTWGARVGDLLLAVNASTLGQQPGWGQVVNSLYRKVASAADVASAIPTAGTVAAYRGPVDLAVRLTGDETTVLSPPGFVRSGSSAGLFFYSEWAQGTSAQASLTNPSRSFRTRMSYDRNPGQPTTYQLSDWTYPDGAYVDRSGFTLSVGGGNGFFLRYGLGELLN